MKKVFIFILISLIAIYGKAQVNSFQFSVDKIEGGKDSLVHYQGMKVLIVIIPASVSPVGDSLLMSLDSLGRSREGQLKIIAVPSVEAGFSQVNRDDLYQWYRSKLGTHIIVSNGMYTRKTSGSLQHPLFKWLTDVAINKVFDIDAEAAGYKFFINSGGLLYGVLLPHSRASGQAVTRTLAIQ
ncbi:MAG TPA: hypothetical protein PLL23_10060 [Chitinophagaceae bacterium]|nr:hypothetical protein [Chitinophagaceae bacterium]